MPALPTEGGIRARLADEEATAGLAEDIGAMLRRGDVIALSGGLGAGKTTFVRALVRALMDDPAYEVPSPTFALRIDHALPRLTLAHADLYRLADTSETEEIGLVEALEDGALVVEWPDRMAPSLGGSRLDVRLELDGTARQAILSGSSDWPARLARTAAIRTFLERSGLPGARRSPLAGDASSRAYERIRVAGKTAILMNAPARPPDPPLYDGRSYDEVAHRTLDIRPFVAIAMALRDAGLHAPEIHAMDLEKGLLLLEDLGSDGLLDPAGQPILERYEAAIDVLIAMHAREWPRSLPLPGGGSHVVPPYDRSALLVEISLFPDWFGGYGGEPAFPPDRRQEFLAEWSRVLNSVEPATTLVMRDCHSPNILWRGGEEGVRRVGLLDFQDALIGHPAYDVVSLAQDARAPLGETEERALKARYLAGRRANDAAFDESAFDAAYATLGLQRATKVLGIFTRLALAEGKPGYQRHRERLKGLIRRNLAHPVLSALRVWYEPYV